METGTEYRISRRMTSLLCAIALGWSTAQFEVSSVAVGPAGTVDLANASIPLVLALAIVYMTGKTILGYAMQPKEVRRWNLAQTDFRLFLFLVRTALLMLAAGGLHRSVDTFVFVAVGVLAIVSGSMLALGLGMMLLVPVIVGIRKAVGRPYRSASPVPYVVEASAWSELIVVVLLVVGLVAFGVSALDQEPFFAFWTAPPDPMAVTVFVVIAIGIVISYWLQRLGETELFARPVPRLTKRTDGTIGVAFPKGEDSLEN